MEIILTEAQKDRIKRNERIVEDFNTLRIDNPDTKTERILYTLSVRYRLTIQQIRNILGDKLKTKKNG